MIAQAYTSLNEPALLAAIIAMFGMLGAGVRFLDNVRVKQIAAIEADRDERIAAVAAGKDAVIAEREQRIAVIIAEREQRIAVIIAGKDALLAEVQARLAVAEKRSDEWQAMALRSTTITAQAVNTAATQTGGAH